MTWGLLVLTMAILVLGGGSYSGSHRKTLRQEVESDLRSIAQLKAAQVATWYSEKSSDASVLGALLSRSRDVAGLLTEHRGLNPDLPDGRQRDILAELRTLKDVSDILLVDPAGRILLSLDGRSGLLDIKARNVLTAAVKGGVQKTHDIQTGPLSPNAYLSFMAPLFDASQPGGRAIGAVILVIEAKNFLYPLIQAWPTQSRTAESILVRQDGDSVLFLNELRHAANAALRLHLPVTQTMLPAVMALRGETGIQQGVDYRGIKVLSAYTPIPGTPWFLVAKEDVAEALSSLRYETTLVLLLTFLGLIAVAASLLLFQQKKSKEIARTSLVDALDHGRIAAHHQVLLHSIGDAVLATNALGQLEMMNLEAERLTGWSSGEAIGRHVEDVLVILDEQTRKPLENPVMLVMRERRAVGLQNHAILLARDGREHPISDSAAPIVEADGTMSGIVMVFRDQTAERATQRELRERELRFRATFEQAAVGMAHVSPDGHFLRVNGKYSEILGYTCDQLQQMTIQQIMPRKTQTAGSDDLKRQLTEMVAFLQREMVLCHKDGTGVWVELSASRVVDEAGEPLYFILVAKDIQNRKQLEQERTLLLSAIEQSNELVVITDIDAKIHYVNPIFAKTTGYTREEVIGLNPRILQSGQHEAAYFADMWQTLTAGKNFEGRIINRQKDGTAFTVQASISPVRDHVGTVVSYVAVMHDITLESKLQEQLQQSQKMEAVGRLAGGVAHDSNNMLGVVLGYAELALGKVEPDQPLHADLIGILNAAKRSSETTRKLLAFARQQTVVPVVLDLNQAVESVLKMLGPLFGGGINVSWRPGVDLKRVRIDPIQVDQFLVNLCVNSRDAIGDAGNILIETDNAVLDESFCKQHLGFVPGTYVMLSVSDNGCGMNVETLSRAFEPFYTSKEFGQGTGLGLSTVYGIVKQNNGFIDIQSESGKGTRILIYLPIVESEVDASRQEESSSIPLGRGQLLLVVEDEPELLIVESMMLEELGYRALAASTPHEAMELAAAHAGEIHLLISDVMMPVMNGRDLAIELRSRYPHLNALLISGYSIDLITTHGELNEGLSFLPKPFSMKDLAVKVQSMIEVA
jgi:two-component system cell cycle sensor histidine kinase/response regulator CckA